MSLHVDAAGSRSISLLDLRLHSLTEREVVRRICDAIRAGTGGWVITPNLDILRRSLLDSELAGWCREADLVVADGMPLVWAARVQGTPLPERVAGSNLIWSLSRAAGEEGYSVFLLGGEPGTADAAAQTLRQRFPNLRIAGTYCPPMGFEKSPEEIGRIRETLCASAPDIIFVALGCPKQERLISQLRGDLPKAWWLGVGISFSFVCGRVKRAPVWMQRIGLEWLHRLVQEPRRLFRRYIVDDLPVALRLFACAFASRWRVRRSPDSSECFPS